MNTHRGEPCGSHRPSEPAERLTLVEAAKRVAYFGHHRRRCPCLRGGSCDCGMAELQRHVFEIEGTVFAEQPNTRKKGAHQ